MCTRGPAALSASLAAAMPLSGPTRGFLIPFAASTSLFGRIAAIDPEPVARDRGRMTLETMRPARLPWTHRCETQGMLRRAGVHGRTGHPCVAAPRRRQRRRDGLRCTWRSPSTRRSRVGRYPRRTASSLTPRCCPARRCVEIARPQYPNLVPTPAARRFGRACFSASISSVMTALTRVGATLIKHST